MPYLVACDLDNTLLTDKKKIKFKSKLFIKKFIKKGNYFIICTGRPLVSAVNFWKQLKIDMPIITDNGASITFPNENKHVDFTIDLDIFRDFYSKIEKYVVCAFSATRTKNVLQNAKEVPQWLIYNGPEIEIVEGRFYDLLNEDPFLPSLWISEDCYDDFVKIIDSYKDIIGYRYWGCFDGKHSFELHSVNASKGLAMKYLSNLYKVDKTISFGDQLNDISMLEMADLGVAMINSNEQVIKNARFVTRKDYNNNGVVDYLIKNKLY